MSYDQTAFSGAIMSAAAACCDDESDRITENLGQYVESLIRRKNLRNCNQAASVLTETFCKKSYLKERTLLLYHI